MIFKQLTRTFTENNNNNNNNNKKNRSSSGLVPKIKE